jgi:hypothetical protein
VGALAVNFWVWAMALKVADTNTTAAMAERMVVLVRMLVKVARTNWDSEQFLALRNRSLSSIRPVRRADL